jgi:hypothetical protein
MQGISILYDCNLLKPCCNLILKFKHSSAYK